MIICIPVPISFLTQKGHRKIKNDIGMDGDTYYNCTIGSILLHSFLLIYHPYPPSFHEMIFILVYVGVHTTHSLHNTCTHTHTIICTYSTLLTECKCLFYCSSKVWLRGHHLLILYCPRVYKVATHFWLACCVLPSLPTWRSRRP